jgi:hypothetical protein
MRPKEGENGQLKMIELGFHSIHCRALAWQRKVRWNLSTRRKKLYNLSTAAPSRLHMLCDGTCLHPFTQSSNDEKQGSFARKSHVALVIIWVRGGSRESVIEF